MYYYPTVLQEDEAIKKRQRGHLKICSKSIVFVPTENQFPILKFPMKRVENMEEWFFGLKSKIDVKDRSFAITSEVYVEMKKDNIISPYVFKKGRREHIFCLNYVTVDDCLPQMCQLHRASTLPPADQSAMINAIVLSRQSRVKFNTSWLEDLYETIEYESQGDKITPLVTNPGRIMLTSRMLYFQPFNNVDRVPVIKIKLKEIRSIIKRRFLLKQIGLEVICDEGSKIPYLYLSQKSVKERDQLYDKVLQQLDLNLEQSGQDDMTLRWQNGVISNMEYLLYLNSCADRSFNDLTQYPVMPWVIQDFTSETLDLDNPDSFRDLSKPIGALNDERLARMKERYTEMPEPKFLYGSHYSTPGYILYYLARAAPEYVLCLQNGKFDQPDRMFNSFYELWQNCLNGAADFKELIPEFYEGDGEYMVHTGRSDFGFRQDGRPVGNVAVPPWASSSKELVHKFREALECDYVSKHIHEWIDLVFGYKQRGLEAEKADNVFYYLTYEGAIDLDSIQDPNERACMEIQIMEFGQIPKQLFKRPHPMRYGPREIPRSLSSLSDMRETNSQDGLLEESESDDTLAAKAVDFTRLEKRLQYSLHKDTVTDVKLCYEGKYVFSVSQDSLLKMYSLEDQRQLRSVTMTSMALSSCLVMPDNKTILCGSWDNNVYFYSVEFGRVLDSLHGHDDAVSCICWKNDILLTSSWDSTVKVWQFTPPSSARSFTPAEFMVQLDHDSGVTYMSLDDDCELLVTGTKDGQICIWEMHDLYSAELRNVHQTHAGRVHCVLLSQDKHQIISCGEDKYLRVMDLESGTEMFVKDVKDTILCLAMLGNMLLSGTESGYIQVWDLDKAQLIHEVAAHTQAVTCLYMSEDCTILSGSADRSVNLYRPHIK